MTDTTSSTKHLGSGLAKLFHAFTSMFDTAGTHAESVADQARTVDVGLQELDKKIAENSAKKREIYRRGLAAYNRLSRSVDAQRELVTNWATKAEAAADQVKKYKEDTPEYAEAMALLQAAAKNKIAAQGKLALLEAELAKAEPAHAGFLKSIAEDSVTSDLAHAAHEQLEMRRDTAEAQQASAEADQYPGGKEVQDLLSEITGKIEHIEANADAEAEIAANTPMSEKTADVRLTMMSQAADTDAEVARLLGKSAEASPTAS